MVVQGVINVIVGRRDKGGLWCLRKVEEVFRYLSKTTENTTIYKYCISESPAFLSIRQLYSYY